MRLPGFTASMPTGQTDGRQTITLRFLIDAASTTSNVLTIFNEARDDEL